VITAATVRDLQAADAGFPTIARDLRATDVHPPLYFWTMAAWRRLAGNSLFAARLASVLFSVITLALVAAIARAAAIPAMPALLLSLGCYAFAYTGAIARGFALAQMLSVAGVALLLRARRTQAGFAAGLLFGAATFANYLAAFVACATLLVQAPLCASRPGGKGRGKAGFGSGRAARSWAACIAFALWLPADAWFFIAQRESRGEQFEPFQPAAAIVRLARYFAAALFGGLPRYVGGPAATFVTTALAVLLLLLLCSVIWRWRRIATPEARRVIAAAAVAPPLGLLLLGLVFNNTPIELRYLAFATPFIGLLLAAALPRRLRAVVLTVQVAALVGLMTRPETMQPARATARAAAALEGDGVVLVPHGNDGVGIVGAFAAESPPALRLLVIPADATPDEIEQRASGYRRVVLALLDQDTSSRASLPAMYQAFADQCWREAGRGFKVLAFERTCGGNQPR
jgi:uncharacterized membrane protein